MVTEKTAHILQWHDQLVKMKSDFRKSEPFPHLVIDHFLTEQDALAASSAFPAADPKVWTNYIHVNERKFGLNNRAHIPASLLKVIDALQSEPFVKTLRAFTGIDNLEADDQLAGGGLHQMYPGGFLNIHSDFLIHPVRRNLKRRINLILFLSPDWNENYGGALEFWNKEMTSCMTRIQPKFNRCVIFLTDEYAYHGCPEKLKGPRGFSRKSLALYYYSPYTELPSKQFTDYKARPVDERERLLIYLDNIAVKLYSYARARFRLSDQFTGRILRTLKFGLKK